MKVCRAETKRERKAEPREVSIGERFAVILAGEIRKVEHERAYKRV